MPKCEKDKDLVYDIKFCREMAKKIVRPWCKQCVINKTTKGKK